MSQVPPAAAPRAAGLSPRPAAVQRLEAVVIAPGRYGPVVEVAGRRFALEGAPALPPAAKTTLETAGALRPGGQPVRIVALDGSMLARPLSVRLRPAPPLPGLPTAPRPAVPAGVPASTARTEAPAPAPAAGTAPPAPETGSGPGAQRMAAGEPASAVGLLEAIRSVRMAHVDPSRRSRPGESPPDRPPSGAAETIEPFRQSQAGSWRLLLLPFGEGPADRLRLYLGEAPGDGGPGADRAGPETPQRAVFDLDLSHLGRCQLDVLCHARRFDLVVRSERRFDAALETAIRAFHHAALEAARWSGSIGFCAELLAMPCPEQPLGAALTA